MSEHLTAHDLAALVRRVFQPTAEDRGLVILVDLPDARRTDHPAWRARREMAADWAAKLAGVRAEIGLEHVTLAWYPNVGSNNADLPATCVVGEAGAPLHHAGQLAGCAPIPLAELLDRHSIVLAPTELSATAPLKVLVRGRAARAATMPGFLAAMIPALRLDYGEVHRRCLRLKAWLDEAESAVIRFRVGAATHELRLDLRHRRATASSGLFPTNGVAGNLPSGETYIVPYEGEIAGDPSRTAGTLPVQFGEDLGNEVVIYRVAANRAVAVLSDGPASAAERTRIAAEPAYANLAELGFGVLDDFGLAPTGSILLDEKLGLHIAFGRSDHFGGRVGPADFSAPQAVVHIDRVYLPALQPAVGVAAAVLEGPGGRREILRDGRYAAIWSD
ncbi:MAG: hypothetical protein JXQ29_01330 [Planctomycetes bacterium]|nr:hypothetical protein [Planctomycetota bacterium]